MILVGAVTLISAPLAHHAIEAIAGTAAVISNPLSPIKTVPPGLITSIGFLALAGWRRKRTKKREKEEINKKCSVTGFRCFMQSSQNFSF
jgi:hypothetical protein